MHPPAHRTPASSDGPGPAHRPAASLSDELEAGGPDGAAPAPKPDAGLSGALAGRSLTAAVWLLSWPVLAESFLNSLVGLTDTLLASNIRDAGGAADAVGGAAYVLWFAGLIAQAVGIAATALVSRAVGARKRALANTAVGQTLILSLVGGVAMGVVLALAAPWVARVLSLSPAGQEAFSIYLLINCVGLPFSGLLAGAIACSRAAGESRWPLVVMALVNVVNVVLSWILSGVDVQRLADDGAGGATTRMVLENPGWLNLGVAGIAWGTVLSYALGAGVMLLVLARGVGGSSGVRMLRKRLRPHPATMTRLVRQGVPNFLEMLGMWAGNFLVIIVVGWLGVGALGAHLVAIRVEAFSYLPGFAFGAAAATLVGQALGAGNAALARKSVWICTALSCGLMGVTSLAFLLFPRELVGLVSAQPSHLELAPGALFIAGCCQLPFAVSIVLRSALRGAGDARAALVITCVGTYLIRLPAAWLLSGADIPIGAWMGSDPGAVIANPLAQATGWRGGLMGVWIGLNLDIIVRAGLLAWRFHGQQWAHQRV